MVNNSIACIGGGNGGGGGGHQGNVPPLEIIIFYCAPLAVLVHIYTSLREQLTSVYLSKGDLLFTLRLLGRSFGARPSCKSLPAQNVCRANAICSHAQLFQKFKGQTACCVPPPLL